MMPLNSSWLKKIFGNKGRFDVPVSCSFHLWLLWLLLRKCFKDLSSHGYQLSSIIPQHIGTCGMLPHKVMGLPCVARKSVYLFSFWLLLSLCVCVCLSLLLSVRIVYLCITEDFHQCLCVPASCYISTVLFPTLVLSFRTLSLCPVLWSYCSTHYLLC